MPIIILLAVCAILFVLWLATKFKNSPKFDKVVKDITEEQPLAEPKSGEVIKKISAAEQNLKKKAAANTKEAERLQKDADTVGDFLTDRGVVKPDNKGKGEASQ